MFKLLLNDAIKICLKELDKKDTKECIQNSILTPIVDYILIQLKPYILGTCMFLVSIVLLIVCILYLIIFPPTYCV